jgi:hypothetical protein
VAAAQQRGRLGAYGKTLTKTRFTISTKPAFSGSLLMCAKTADYSYGLWYSTLAGLAGRPAAGWRCRKPPTRLVGSADSASVEVACSDSFPETGWCKEARYCEYRSQTAFPISMSTLAIETYSTCEHPRAHLSHCVFLSKSRAHASAPAQTILPLRVLTPSLICSASFLLICRQSSMCLHMFFGLLHTA